MFFSARVLQRVTQKIGQYLLNAPRVHQHRNIVRRPIHAVAAIDKSLLKLFHRHLDHIKNIPRLDPNAPGAHLNVRELNDLIHKLGEAIYFAADK